MTIGQRRSGAPVVADARRAAPRARRPGASRSSPGRSRRTRCSAKRASRSSSERRHDPRGGRHRLPRRPGRARSCCATPAPTSTGERVRFPRGLCRSIVQATAPRGVHAVRAQPASTTCMIGGTHRCSRPNYGSPFVHDLDRGRRYGTIEDFRNFVKLAYSSPWLHHSRRHGVRAGRPAGQQAPLRHGLRAHPLQRQAVHGLGDAAAAAPQDSVDMARIAFSGFGDDYLDDAPGDASASINANSPLVWDAAMLGAARVYAAGEPGRRSSRRSSSPARWRR